MHLSLIFQLIYRFCTSPPLRRRTYTTLTLTLAVAAHMSIPLQADNDVVKAPLPLPDRPWTVDIFAPCDICGPRHRSRRGGDVLIS